MPLGIELNNIAPQLIQNSGAALVQGIRQIGQQISGHLTELQTKRDLGAMAQEMQGLNVQSDQFPVQLSQMLFRHPLAAKDERAKMPLISLGEAHGAWKAGEAEARAFERQMKRQELMNQGAADRAEAARKAAASRTKVGNKIVDLTDPNNPVTVFEGDPLNPPMPFTNAPGGGVLDKRSGQITPGPAKTMTPYQAAQLRRAERKDKISAINQEINQFDSDIASAVRQYESSFDREQKSSKPEEAAKHQKDKTEIGNVADALKAEKKKRLDILKQLRDEDAVDAAVVDDEEALGLPPVTPQAATAELPVLTPAQAAKLPKGAKFKGTDGATYTR